jgi:methylphosphotriester-DNA--protein-cysteine methyltransferase
VVAIDTSDDLTVFRTLLARVATNPAEFTDATTLACSAGVTVRRLIQLVSEHAHLTPALWLQRLRVRKAASGLLQTLLGVGDIGAGSGFASEGDFEAQFFEEKRMSPAAFRGLGWSRGFQVSLPEGYRPHEVLAYHARDPEGLRSDQKAIISGRRWRRPTGP